jgi:hypothetical protein
MSIRFSPILATVVQGARIQNTDFLIEPFRIQTCTSVRIENPATHVCNAATTSLLLVTRGTSCLQPTAFCAQPRAVAVFASVSVSRWSHASSVSVFALHA